MRLGERLAAALKRLMQPPAPAKSPKAAASPGGAAARKAAPKGTGGPAPGGGGGSMPKPAKPPAPGTHGAVPGGSGAAAPAAKAAMPEGAKKTAAPAAGKLPGGSAGTAPRGTGGPAPKGSAAALPGRLDKTAASTRPSPGKDRPLPKGSGAKGKEVKRPPALPGSSVPEGGKSLPALPKSSWQTAPKPEGTRPGTGGGTFLATEELPLTGPPQDPARQLSELLRVQRRMSPGAERFGEEVL